MRFPNFDEVPNRLLVDIVIRAKNGHDLTQKCLESIVDNTPPELYRIVLVDDGSEPPLDGSLADFVVRNQQSAGAVTASNLGLAVSLSRMDTPYVLIFDNDIRVPEGDTGWLARMITELEEGGAKVAAVGASTNFANAPQHILTVPQTYTHKWESERSKKGGIAENPAITTFVSFAVMLRKDAVRNAGLWDEQYNPGNYEDTDYSIVLRQAGYEIRVARSVYIHHDGHKTFGEDLQRLLTTNQAKFIGKWGPGRLFDLGLVGHEFMEKACEQRRTLLQQYPEAADDGTKRM